MRRVLLTGMSGTGKSTVIAALAARSCKAIDLDSDEWSHWVRVGGDPASSAPTAGDLTGGGPAGGNPAGSRSGASQEPAWVWDRQDWVWREDRVRRLLATEDADVLFVGGCAPNQGLFYAQFDHIVLLSAPIPVLLERLASRTNNPYGKRPAELARVLGHVATVEPRLRRVASLEVDTSAPVDQVVETILSHVRA